jgi:uridylate kinase
MELHLKVMDMSAFSLCDEHNIPIVVFDIQSPESIKKIILGESVGTLISREG